MSDLRFERLKRLITEEDFERLSQAHVLVLGLGGVGGYAVEMLARSGIGQLTLIDGDKIDITNCNRQLIALESAIGMNKAEAWGIRCKEINPSIKVNVRSEFIRSNDDIETLLSNNYSAAIDAIDEVKPKLEFMIETWQRKIPCISSMGAGGKFSLSEIKVTDISKTQGCPLARVIRSRLRDRGITKGVPVVFSPEIPQHRFSGAVGSFACVPGVFGITCAQWVITRLLGKC